MSPPFGAHMSVAGGLPRAVDRARIHRCDALQIFTKNASQWRGRLLPPEEIAEFRAQVAAARLAPVVSHASYLINLATANPILREQSTGAMRDEIDRADALGLAGVVLHPGAYGAGTVTEGLRRIAETLTDLFRARADQKTLVLLEHTAGQGTALGSTFEQLAAIIDGMRGNPRVGICLDTCHLLASGYDIVSPEGYAETFSQFERLIGFDRLKVVHVNDSKKPLGSRVDRHTHIGEGCIGLEPFRRLVNDPRFAQVPLLLETPKEINRGSIVTLDRYDEQNLTRLRGLVSAP